MEDAKEKVRARSSAATEVTDGSKELSKQIAMLMATLNRAELGTCPVTTSNSPRHWGHGRGQMDRNTPAHPSSHNGQTGLGQNTPACSSSAASGVATASQGRGSTQALTCAKGNAQNMKVSSTLQCFRCQGLGHIARECATPEKAIIQKWGNQGNAPIPFLNPNPIACLVGHSNEHKCSVLQRDHPPHPAPGLVIRARGDGGCSHPIPQICGGKPPDSGDKKL